MKKKTWATIEHEMRELELKSIEHKGKKQLPQIPPGALSHLAVTSHAVIGKLGLTSSHSDTAVSKCISQTRCLDWLPLTNGTCWMQGNASETEGCGGRGLRSSLKVPVRQDTDITKSSSSFQRVESPAVERTGPDVLFFQTLRPISSNSCSKAVCLAFHIRKTKVLTCA